MATLANMLPHIRTHQIAGVLPGFYRVIWRWNNVTLRDKGCLMVRVNVRLRGTFMSVFVCVGVYLWVCVTRFCDGVRAQSLSSRAVG